MSNDGHRFGCSKCDCPGFASLSNICSFCRHSNKKHSIYHPGPAYGALATYLDETGWRFASKWGHTSGIEVEGELLRYCIELGRADPAVRIQGYNTFLAIAKSSDGRVGWASDDKRATAEGQAVKNCGDQKHPWVYSIHTKDGAEHNHVSGEGHCKQ
jgi:hypothetical protein